MIENIEENTEEVGFLLGYCVLLVLLRVVTHAQVRDQVKYDGGGIW